MDNFSYGSYVGSFVKTVAFEDSPELDPSGTDRLYNKYELTVQFVISYGIDPGKPGETPADVLRRIREDIMSPRQSLFYSQNGKAILDVDGPDAANGPFPESFRTILVSPGSLTVEFKVVCRTAECQTGKTRGWCSNRWEQSDSYDKLGYCTTTIKGLLIGRSDLNQATIDQFRGMVTPGIRNGYQREDFNYTVSPDGLRLAYQFDDKEYYLPPPIEGLDWDGEFRVVASNGVVKGSCTVVVRGGKTANKAAMWQRANLIALSRIRPLVPDGPDKIPINTAGFREKLSGAEIEVDYSVQLDPAKVSLQAAGNVGVGAFAQFGGGVLKADFQNKIAMYGADLIGNPIPGLSFTNQPGIAPPIRGNQPLIQLVTAIFHDPCRLEAELATGPIIPGSASPGAIATNNPTPRPLGNPSSITVNNVPFQLPPTASPSQSLAYTRYSVTSTYVNRMNVTSLTPTDKTKLREFVDLGPPELDLIVEWVIEKTGRMPELPDPCPPSNVCDVYKLLNQTVSPDRPEVTPMGDLNHKIFGRYEYGVRDPSRVTIAEPLPPFLVGQVLRQDPYGKNPDVIWKFLTVDQSQYWQRCCDASTNLKPPLNAELRGNPGIFGAPPGTVGGELQTIQFDGGLSFSNPGVANLSAPAQPQPVIGIGAQAPPVPVVPPAPGR